MSTRACLIAAVLCFAAAQWLASGPLTGMRAAVVANGDVFGALPPGEFAGTLMLGGFRGLACDLMWMRAQNARQAGRTYESVAMAQAIVRVQPRFEQIWEFLTYDMIYNVAAETEDPEGKWAWFLAGIEVNVQGIVRNPHSDRLIRHCAWMFHHKGDGLRERIAARDWAPLLNPMIEALNAQLPPERRIAALPSGSRLGNFQISELIYEASLRVCERRAKRPPAVARSMVVHAIERDGNQARNRGEHLAALRRYLTALGRWDSVLAWTRSPADDADDAEQRRIHGEIAEHNQGRLRRKAQLMAEQLAPDAGTGAQAVELIGSGKWAEAERLIAGAGWKPSAAQVRVRWLDE